MALRAAARLAFVVGAALGLGFLASPAWAQPAPTNDAADADPSSAAAREIRLKVDELLRLRDERRRRDQAHRDKIDALRRQVELLTRQTEETEAALATERKELGEYQAKINEAAELSRRSGDRIVRTAQLLVPVAERTVERILTDASRDKPRRSGELSAALEQLRRPDPKQSIEGFRDVVRLIGTEWTPARAISVENETVELEGGAKQVHAWTLTVGFVARGLVSEDHVQVGLLSGATGQTWRFGLPSGEEDRIRDVVRIVRGQKPPSLAVMPIPVPASEAKAIPARGDQGQATPPAQGK